MHRFVCERAGYVVTQEVQVVFSYADYTSSWYILRSRIAESYPFLILLRTCHEISITVLLLAVLNCMVWDPFFLQLAGILLFDFWITALLTGVRWYLTVLFIYIFPESSVYGPFVFFPFCLFMSFVRYLLGSLDLLLDFRPPHILWIFIHYQMQIFCIVLFIFSSLCWLFPHCAETS